MNYLSVINFIRSYVNDFCCDLTSCRADYIKLCRNLVKRVEEIYFNSLTCEEFIFNLYNEVLFSRNANERKLFSGLIAQLKRLKKHSVIF